MKSEHRHDLKTNELGRLVTRATPFLERHANSILIALGVLIVVAGVAVYWAKSTSPSAAGWTAMLNANTAEEYAGVAENYPNTEVGDWASLIEAESYLENGIRSSFTNRESAKSDLEKSREILEKLSSKSGVPEGIRKRALFALARCAETSGNVDQALKLYNQLTNEYKDDPVYKELADGRISTLETSGAQDFYAWFRKQNPKPEDRQQPRDGLNDPFGLPPGHPPVLTLPEFPEELKLPKSEEGAKATSNESSNADGTSPAGTPPQEGESSKSQSAPSEPEKAAGEQDAATPSPTGSNEVPADKPAPSEK